MNPVQSKLYTLCLLGVLSGTATAQELIVGKTCPVLFAGEELGVLAFSREWYHSGRADARYTPGDNATGVGVEIHFFAGREGALDHANRASCDRYRILQVRETTARLFNGESAVQIDVPPDFESPFYDNAPLEHGYGTHRTPTDDRDKPWKGQALRASTVAIYDTPYVSDYYGIEGKNIRVGFETCVVCERTQGYDSILSCGTWGYTRYFIDDDLRAMNGWSEPEFNPVQCRAEPSQQFQRTLQQSTRIEYSYWLDWREGNSR